MDHVRVPVRLINGDRVVTVDALVDTGSTIMVITRYVANALGLNLGKVSVELVDGSGRVVDYIAVEVELMGRRRR
ncbi:aspartyl protease family protein [Vulcanisaeta sp. JCM 14467]|uniref:aspartyl protease family protein n=1 Tax=Vulcanisaeta sp. JCM 14467 TaxID=1295370 RepID=UPI0006CFE6D7|nr:aspartyl protease family protein [Vulcanisaeta sp. JCM 14467]